MTNPGEPYGQWDTGSQMTPPKPKNGLGTAALVFGILAILSLLVVGWIPFIGIITVIIGLVAVIMGVVARGRVRKQQATNGGAALTGLVLGLLSFVIGLILQVLGIALGIAFLNTGGAESLEQFQQCLTQAQQAPDPAAVQQAIEQCSQQFGQQMPNFGGEAGGEG